MRAGVSIFVAMALMSAVRGQILNCERAANKLPFLAETGKFGCDGEGEVTEQTWTILPSKSAVERLLYFTDTKSFGVGHAFYLQIGGVDELTLTGEEATKHHRNNPIVIPGCESAVVKFAAAPGKTPWWHKPKFTVVIAQMPANYVHLNAATSQELPGVSPGISYYAMWSADVSELLFRLRLNSYTGIKDPMVFLGHNFLPTIENHLYSNTSVCDLCGDIKCTVTYTLLNPMPGLWIAGIYSLGDSASVENLHSGMTINATDVSSGEAVEITGPSSRLFRFATSLTATSNVTISLARLPPGGTTAIYVSKGLPPTASWFDYTLSTATKEFVRVTFPDDPKEPGPNPPYYYLRVLPRDSAASVISVRVDTELPEEAVVPVADSDATPPYVVTVPELGAIS